LNAREGGFVFSAFLLRGYCCVRKRILGPEGFREKPRQEMNRGGGADD
jgi:hypothetical protein